MSLEDLELRIIDLEDRLRPIADRPVNITEPGWARRLTQAPHPLDEAGVRSMVEALLDELFSAYQTADQEGRQALRNLFVEYRAFAWTATLPSPPTTEESFRRHLVLFSLKDQERDSRDTLLWLHDLCRQAIDAGVNIGPILREVAALSSSHNRYGMGSTQAMLLTECQMNPGS